MIKNIYILSGLGADERVFQKLDFGEHHVHFIQWIEPLEKESINEYAARLLEQIKHENPVLIGLSFGGMMAIEVSKLVSCEQIILLSSAKTRREIPFYFRWTGTLGLHKLVPTRLLKWPNRFSDWLFGAKTPLERRLLKIILEETSPNYLRWSVDQVLSWKNTYVPGNLTHIHGTKDYILPIRFVSCDIRIRGGRHFMVLSRADEISVILRFIIH
ncbi:MAG: hypothetical protein K0R65_207 [Crocinitomicaceae bacterium]|jgi:pimeloyl-ACP methyl ester carboxylesterase|nr:hypothetical protein [Crocinitomicaceae bacterium]